MNLIASPLQIDEKQRRESEVRETKFNQLN